ncbi:MAG: hypothetical protein LUG52_04875 [Clostridia bacterium]|nr:hypothetical protein [Clostridia bacterium]
MVKTKLTRLLCFALSLAMAFALIAAPAYASETDTDTDAETEATAEETDSDTPAETTDGQTSAETVVEQTVSVQSDDTNAGDNDSSASAASVEEDENTSIMLLSTANSTLSGTLAEGTYTLDDDLEVSDGLTVSSDEVTIDLNGNTLTADIEVTGGSLTIKDSTTEEYENVAGYGGTLDGDFTISGGAITICGGNYTGTVSATGYKDDDYTFTCEHGTFTNKMTSYLKGYMDEDAYFEYNLSEGYFYTTTKYYTSVTTDDGIAYYATFADAMEVANVSGTTATVNFFNLQNGPEYVVLDNGIDIVGDVTIDFSECGSLSLDSDFSTDYIFSVTANAALTIKGLGCYGMDVIKNSSATSTNDKGYIGILVDGGTLTMGKDSYVNSYYGIMVKSSGTVNVTGGEASVTGSDTGIYVESGTVNIACNSGGVSGGTYGVYLANSSCELTVSDGTIESDDCGIYSNGAKVNVNGGTVSGDNYGIYATGGTVAMSSGSVSATNSTKAALYVTNGCKFNMTGGGIQGGTTGLYVDSESTATITGSPTIEGTTYAIYAKGAVAITNIGTSEIGMNDSYCVYSDGGTVTIDSGWFTGSSENCIGTTNSGSVTITGGMFSSDVTDYVDATNCEISANEDGTYTVTETTTGVAQNTTTGTKYTTLKEAIDGATDGETVQLLAEITLNEDLEVNPSGSVTLDLAGYNLTINSGVTLKVSDSSSDGTGAIVIIDSATDKGLVTNNGTIAVESGTLNIRDLGYTTDSDGSGLFAYQSGTISIGASGTFIVPDAWATEWPNQGIWDPTWSTADHIFSDLTSGAQVYTFGEGWQYSDSGWALSGTYLVEYFKTVRGGDDIAEATNTTWKYPEKSDSNEIFAGWYTDSTYETSSSATSGVAYARFVRLDKESGNNGVINYLGASLRKTESYDSADLRFGYDIAIPSDCKEASWGWTWSEKDSTTTVPKAGTESTTARYNTYDNAETTFRSNLVITGIEYGKYTTDYCATLTVTYTTADGTTVYAVGATRDSSVQYIAQTLANDNTVDDETTYANGILNKINSTD